jgi:hypothetical protein
MLIFCVIPPLKATVSTRCDGDAKHVEDAKDRQSSEGFVNTSQAEVINHHDLIQDQHFAARG